MPPNEVPVDLAIAAVAKRLVMNLSLDDVPPSSFQPYHFPCDPGECWFVSVPPVHHALGGSRLIAVSRRTGEIIYDGSDGGE